MITPKTSHVLEATESLFSQYQKAKIQALLTTYVEQLQDLEITFSDVCNVLNLDTAQNAQLDLLGTLLDVGRDGRNDDDYRLVLRGKVASNRSRGTAADLIELLCLLIGKMQAFSFVEYFPATLHITIPEPVAATVDINLVNDLLQRSKAAGVSLVLIFVSAEPYFGFLGDPDAAGFNVGAFAGALNGV